MRSVKEDARRRAIATLALGAALAVTGAVPACGPAGGERLATAASVLDAEDSRDLDRDAWSAWLGHDDETIRRLAARAVGRLRAPALAPLAAGRLEREPARAVREELLFALGQLGAGEARPALEAVAGGARGTERALAVEALGKLGGGASEVVLRAALDDEEDLVRREALYALVRVRGRRVAEPPPIDPGAGRALAARLAGLTTDDAADVRLAAAYALAEIPLPGRTASLAALLDDPDPACRLFAVRALGRIAGGDAAAARALLAAGADEDVHVAAAIAAAIAPLRAVGAGRAVLRAATRADSAAAFHVRAAAVTALAARVESGLAAGAERDAALAAIDAARADPSPTVRRAALVASARARADSGRPGAAEHAGGVLDAARRASDDGDPWTRAAAMRAAVHLPRASGRAALLRRGLRDPDARVATAALEAVGTLDATSPFEPRPLALGILRGEFAEAGLPAVATADDLAVRATALGLLGEHGTPGDGAAIEAELRGARGFAAVELRLAALDALAAVLGERAVPVLAEFAGDPSPAVAVAAARLAGEHGAGPPPEPHPDARRSSVSLAAGVDVLSAAPNPRARLETEAGILELELLREDAPRHVASFVALAREGAFDGLTFHRVVTGFVVQGLDPRGDGWGSGEVFLRDEINRARYGRGTLGMPNAGPDTAGCQVFVTHVPTPHLDGRYTVFGRVTRGLDVLDRLEVGHVVHRVTVE